MQSGTYSYRVEVNSLSEEEVRKRSLVVELADGTSEETLVAPAAECKRASSVDAL